MKTLSCLEIAGITPEEIEKWKAQGFGRAKPSVNTIDKSGDAAATEAAVISRWINVTPAMAAAWLKNNFVNRLVSDDTVAAYARDMANGVWQPTHQGIAFNDADALIDGQHRLLAIVRAKKTIRTMVTFGLPAKIEGSQMTTMDCVDRGRTRSVADQLKIQHGLKNGTQITQVATAIAGLCHERIRRPSVDQILRIYREFSAGMDYVIEHRSKKEGLRSAGVLAGFAFAMQADDACLDWGGKVAEMFTSLNNAGKPGTYPNVQLLRETLTGQDAALLDKGLTRSLAELTVQVIYLELKNQRVARLQFSLDGVNHFRAGQPERVAEVAAMFALPCLEKVEVLADDHQRPQGPQSAKAKGEKLYRCECGTQYAGKRHQDGCKDCRKKYEVHSQKRSGVKMGNTDLDEVLAGEAA
jgi:hypothetical protein